MVIYKWRIKSIDRDVFASGLEGRKCGLKK